MVFAILLAAGSSQRYGENKLDLPLGASTVWLKSFHALSSHPEIDAVGVVTSSESVERYRMLAPEAAWVIPGGSTRVESTQLGIQQLPDNAEIILIHDAARPWIDHETVSRVIAGIRKEGAAYAAVPVNDTIRNGHELLDREQLLAAQTPQGAQRHWISPAYQNPPRDATDDVAILAAAGFRAVAVLGNPKNRKITNPGDLPQPMEIRTGLGYDVHAFSTDSNRPMWLGGIEYPDDKPGLDGHSDADALVHAVVDAVLGAIGLGDIGEHFPNTDPEWKDCPSLRFLEHAANLVKAQKFDIINVDASVLAERPKIMPRRREMEEAMALALGISSDRVSVKATTNERLGAIGRGEGIAAFAVATLRRESI